MTNRVLAGYGYGSCTFSFEIGKILKSLVRKKFNQLSYNYLIQYLKSLTAVKVTPVLAAAMASMDSVSQQSRN